MENQKMGWGLKRVNGLGEKVGSVLYASVNFEKSWFCHRNSIHVRQEISVTE